MPKLGPPRTPLKFPAACAPFHGVMLYPKPNPHPGRTADGLRPTNGPKDMLCPAEAPIPGAMKSSPVPGTYETVSAGPSPMIGTQIPVAV